jgi:HPt (histidine-containing phosphotransfer) domain-containing protein
MDGIEATRLIRGIDSDYARNIPIIALTANAIVGNEEMFLNKGFQAFVSKPIEISRLDAVIREWVRDKEHEKLYTRQDEAELDAAQENQTERRLLEKEIPGLNIEKGLNRFGGDGETYLNVMSSYVKNTPALLEDLQDALKDKERIAEYETIVHGIKGSSRAIFADETGDMAEALEKAANAGNYDYIAANDSAFTDTARKLISDIEAMLAEMRAGRNKPKKDKPDAAVLERLREACINYEMANADEAIAELEAFEYESDGELVAWLRENAEQTNFDEIAERLSASGE